MNNEELFSSLGLNDRITKNQVIKALQDNNLLISEDDLDDKGKELLKDFVNIINDTKDLYDQRVRTDKKFALKYKGFTTEELDKIIKNLINFNSKVLDAEADLTFNNIDKIIYNYDLDLVKTLSKVYNVLIGKFNIGTASSKKIVSEMLDIFKEEQKTLNSRIKANKKVVSTYLANIDSINNAICRFANNAAFAETLLDNCIYRTKNFWLKSKVEIIEPLLKKLSTNIYTYNDKDNNLSVKEVVELSNQCATLFLNSSDNKVEDACMELMALKQYILDNYTLDNANPDNIELVKNKKLKEIIKRAPIILTSDSQNLEFARHLLCGKSFKEAVNLAYGNKLTTADIDAFKDSYNIKINATLNDLSRIFVGNVTAFDITPSRICSVFNHVKDAFNLAYGKVDIFDKVITGNNFNQLNLLNIKDFSKDSCVYALAKIFKDPNELLYYINDNISMLNLKASEVVPYVKELFSLDNLDVFDYQERLKDIFKGKYKNLEEVKSKTKARRDSFSRKMRLDMPIAKNNTQEYLPNLENIKFTMDALNVDGNKQNKFLKEIERTSKAVLDYDNKKSVGIIKEEDVEDYRQLEEELKRLDEIKKQESLLLEQSINLDSQITNAININKNNIETKTKFKSLIGNYKNIVKDYFTLETQINLEMQDNSLRDLGFYDEILNKLNYLHDLKLLAKEKITDELNQQKRILEYKNRELEKILANEKEYNKSVSFLETIEVKTKELQKQELLIRIANTYVNNCLQVKKILEDKLENLKGQEETIDSKIIKSILSGKVEFKIEMVTNKEVICSEITFRKKLLTDEDINEVLLKINSKLDNAWVQINNNINLDNINHSDIDLDVRDYKKINLYIKSIKDFTKLNKYNNVVSKAVKDLSKKQTDLLADEAANKLFIDLHENIDDIILSRKAEVQKQEQKLNAQKQCIVDSGLSIEEFMQK